MKKILCLLTLGSVIQGDWGGSNKKGDWNFSSNLISGQAPITAGRMGKDFICVGKKNREAGNFLTINKWVGSNNSGQDGKFP